ncbi:MAG: hypothetical protein ACRD1U_15500 [Vicinamibacterales bacterium]
MNDWKPDTGNWNLVRRPLAAVLALLATSQLDAQALRAIVAVGARYAPAPDERTRQRDLDDMRRLRFNVVSLGDAEGRQGRLAFLDRVIANAPYPGVELSGTEEIAIVPVKDGGDDLAARAWSALARGARGVLFDDWAALARNTAALAAAAEFTEAVTRNAALYAPLRPRTADLRTAAAPETVEVRLLESAAAIVIIAINHTPARQSLDVGFPRDIPEAIWRNMVTGASVSFVMGADGPAYKRSLAPHEVLVLAINKTLR